MLVCAAVKEIPARRWLGLTATPYRRDKLDDLIAMQAGPVRHTIAISCRDHDHGSRKCRVTGSSLVSKAGESYGDPPGPRHKQSGYPQCYAAYDAQVRIRVRYELEIVHVGAEFRHLLDRFRRGLLLSQHYDACLNHAGPLSGQHRQPRRPGAEPH